MKTALFALALLLSAAPSSGFFASVPRSSLAVRCNKSNAIPPPVPYGPVLRGGAATPADKLKDTFANNYFLFGMLTSIGLASQLPAQGKTIAPFLNQYGVRLVFLLTGACRRANERSWVY